MMPSAPVQAFRRSGHSAIVARTVSRGIPADTFMRDLFRLSSLLWCFQQATSSKTPEVYIPEGWGLDSQRANPRRW